MTDSPMTETDREALRLALRGREAALSVALGQMPPDDRDGRQMVKNERDALARLRVRFGFVNGA